MLPHRACKACGAYGNRSVKATGMKEVEKALAAKETKKKAPAKRTKKIVPDSKLK